MATDSHFPKRSEELIAEIARNREELAVHWLELRRSLDVRQRVQHSFHQHTGMFLGAAAVLGGLLAFIPSSRRSRQEKRVIKKEAIAQEDRRQKTETKSLVAILLGLAGKAALDMGKPILLKMLRDHLLSPHSNRSHDVDIETPQAG